MIHDFHRYSIRFLLVLTVLAISVGTVWGQGGTGELTGLVTDPSGAVVADAQVTLINSATGDKRTTITTPAGIYRFTSLPVVGTYSLEMAPKGFKGTKIANIIISTGTTASQDIKLELGQASEQVTVEAGAETVQTTDSSLSTLVDRNIWQSMPLQIRNQNSFIELVAGAVPQDGTNNNRGAAVNGTREGAGSYLVDGTDNNDQGQAGRGQISFYDKGGAATSISPDAIQEYRVITNSFSAEYGKGGGFITDTVLKSGTNQWHGSAYEYNRIQALTANDWFSNNAGLRDHLVRNQFGGSLGGPIIKDKTFFYGVGEIHRVRQSAPLPVQTSTTQQFLDFVSSGQFETFQETDPNGFCMQNLLAACPGALNLSNTTGPIFNSIKAIPTMNFPLATSNFTNVGAGLFTAGMNYPVPVYGQVTVVDPTSQNEARFSIKVDHRFSDKDTVSGVYLFQDATYIDKYIGGLKILGTQYIQDGRGQNMALSWNHTFSPTILNTAKFNYLRHRLDFPAPEGAFGTPAYYSIDGTGVDLGLATGSPQFFTDNEFEYLDTISVVRGKHSMKFGGEYRRTRNGSRFYNDNFSTVLPWGIEDTLTDLSFSDQADQLLNGGHVFGGAYYISAALDPTTGTAPNVYRGYRANEVDFFAQDDWRITNRLTLNLGLRWEYFGPPHNFQSGIDSNYYFGSPVPVPPPTPPAGIPSNPFFPGSTPLYASFASGSLQVRNNEIWNKDSNNFGPRVGFAWDVLGNQKVVVRAGFGVMYDRIYNNTFENIRFNPPFYSDNQIGGVINGVPVGPLSSPGLFAFPFTDTARAQFNNPAFAPVPNPRHMDQNIVTPYYEQFHFGVQWEFAKGWVLEPEYVGTLGHKLTGLSDLNTFNGRVACDPRNAPFDPTSACVLDGFADGIDTTRINPNIGQDNFRSNGYDSNYHAFQAMIRKSYSSGLTIQGSYTYSKTLDDTSDLFNGAAGKFVTDSMNHQADYGPADFDTKHRVVVTLGYELPFMKQNRWLGGWGVNTITSWQSGHPWSPFSSSGTYDLNKDGNNTDRIVALNGDPGSTYTHGSPPNGIVDPTMWGLATCPADVNGGLFCDSPARRNSVYGPAAANVDFNVNKKFAITERMALTFQANFFDLFNHPNFLPPTAGSAGSMNFRQADFGASRQTWGDNGGHRVTQLALRFEF